MANMSTAYRGPDPSLITLVNELRGHYGNPVRTYEFVTGYKSPDNFSGHNPDSDGFVHAVDIFTDDHGNIPEAEGRALAERLRLFGKRTGRFSYLIHDMSPGVPNPLIAGKHTNWEWVPYLGADAHSDHIHLSIADGYWGDPCNVPAYITNDTSRWGVTGATAQSGNITPITEDGFDMAEVEDVVNALLGAEVDRADGKGKISVGSMLRYYAGDVAGLNKNLNDVKAHVGKRLDMNISAVPGKVLTTEVTRAGLGGTTTLGKTVSWMDANLNAIQGASAEAIAAAIPKDLAAQVIAALSSQLNK